MRPAHRRWLGIVPIMPESRAEVSSGSGGIPGQSELRPDIRKGRPGGAEACSGEGACLLVVDLPGLSVRARLRVRVSSKRRRESPVRWPYLPRLPGHGEPLGRRATPATMAEQLAIDRRPARRRPACDVGSRRAEKTRRGSEPSAGATPKRNS